MGNYYSYMRISTKEERSMQKFSRQEKSLESYAKNNGIEYLVQFKDDSSGKDFNRSDWKRLEKLAREGDTIIFKDISRFTRECENGYMKYMEFMDKGIELVFIDNPTVSTSYIKGMMNIAEQQAIVARTALEGTVKLLLIVELDRVEKEREITVQRIKQGIAASPKIQGRKAGQLDKLSGELRLDIEKYLKDRTIKQVDLMDKHQISRNTLKKYVSLLKQEQSQMKGQMKLPR